MKTTLTIITASLLITTASAETYDQSNMWGTTPNNQSTLESSTMHAQNGVVAGQANAARDGMLYSNGDNLSIYSIGSQSIVNNSVTGSSNKIDIDADQESNNNGDIENNGKLLRD